MSQQLLNLVIAHPVMLFVVEHRNKHIDVREQILQSNVPSKFYCVIRASSPFGKLLVQLMAPGDDLIAQWFKQSAKESFTAATWKNGNLRLQRYPSVRKFRAAFAPAR